MLFVILGILKTKLSLNKACLYYQAFWHPVHTIADEDLTVYGFKKKFYLKHGKILEQVKNRKNMCKRRADYPVNIQDDFVIGKIKGFSPGYPASFPTSYPGFAEL